MARILDQENFEFVRGRVEDIYNRFPSGRKLYEYALWAKYAVDIETKDGVKEWCDDNLKGLYELTTSPYNKFPIRLFLELEDDLFLVKLRW